MWCTLVSLDVDSKALSNTYPQSAGDHCFVGQLNKVGLDPRSGPFWPKTPIFDPRTSDTPFCVFAPKWPANPTKPTKDPFGAHFLAKTRTPGRQKIWPKMAHFGRFGVHPRFSRAVLVIERNAHVVCSVVPLDVESKALSNAPSPVKNDLRALCELNRVDLAGFGRLALITPQSGAGISDPPRARFWAEPATKPPQGPNWTVPAPHGRRKTRCKFFGFT